jgi:tetraacyldisaccharide 4'-kinase
MQLTPGEVLPVSGDSAARRPLSSFRGSTLHAVAGIGNPGRFFAALSAQGLDIIPHPFPDHHPFVPQELAFADGLAVLMTEKDAVKCRTFARQGLWYVPVTAAFDGVAATDLLDQVSRKLGI